MKRLFLLPLILVFVSSVFADAKASMSNSKSLYERLGGQEALVKVVDQFVANCGADQRINSFFAAAVADPARMQKFKNHLVTQICSASGGTCTYTGKDMVSTHRGMAITNVHFDALVEDLVKALDHFKVGKSEKDELLAILGPMRKDIVKG